MPRFRRVLDNGPFRDKGSDFIGTKAAEIQDARLRRDPVSIAFQGRSPATRSNDEQAMADEAPTHRLARTLSELAEGSSLRIWLPDLCDGLPEQGADRRDILRITDLCVSLWTGS